MPPAAMRPAAPGNWPTGRRQRRWPVSGVSCWRGGSPPTTSARPSPSFAPTRWTSRRGSRRGREKNRRRECGRSHVRWTTPGGGMTMTLDRLDRVVAEPVFGRRDPDARGYFGAYGGRFVPETLVEPVAALERAYFAARADRTFVDELVTVLRQFVGCPRTSAAASSSSARTWPTPARTRSTTPSARRCWPSGWARHASSPRRAPA